MLLNASGMLAPTTSMPWLRSTSASRSPRSRTTRACSSMLSASLTCAGSAISALAMRVSASTDSVPRARPAAMARPSSTVSWVVVALVEATLISGPASVGTTMCDSRAIALSGTFTIESSVCFCALA